MSPLDENTLIPSNTAITSYSPSESISENTGEILYKGRHIFLGYLNKEEETRKVFDEEGYYHSGDIGEFDEDGYLLITGRIKEIIIGSGGENIYEYAFFTKSWTKSTSKLNSIKTNFVIDKDNYKINRCLTEKQKQLGVKLLIVDLKI